MRRGAASRGFSETDAPDDEEMVRRVAIERAPISPEMGTVMIQALNPDFFDQAAKAGAEESGIPDDISAANRRDDAGAAGTVSDGTGRWPARRWRSHPWREPAAATSERRQIDDRPGRFLGTSRNRPPIRS